jgi:hypothetical protein
LSGTQSALSQAFGNNVDKIRMTTQFKVKEATESDIMAEEPSFVSAKKQYQAILNVIEEKRTNHLQTDSAYKLYVALQCLIISIPVNNHPIR